MRGSSRYRFTMCWLLRAASAITLIILAVALAGKFRGSYVSDAGFQRIENGMTLREVEEIFGRHADVANAMNAPQTGGLSTWHGFGVDYFIRHDQGEDGEERVTCKFQSDARAYRQLTHVETAAQWLGVLPPWHADVK